MEKIEMEPNIWLDVYNEFINHSLKSEIHQKSFKFSEDLKISEKIFKKIILEALTKKYEELKEESYKK